MIQTYKTKLKQKMNWILIHSLSWVMYPQNLELYKYRRERRQFYTKTHLPTVTVDFSKLFDWVLFRMLITFEHFKQQRRIQNHLLSLLSTRFHFIPRIWNWPNVSIFTLVDFMAKNAIPKWQKCFLATLGYYCLVTSSIINGCDFRAFPMSMPKLSCISES